MYLIHEIIAHSIAWGLNKNSKCKWNQLYKNMNMLYLSNPFIIYLHTWKNLHSNLENRKDGEGNRLAKMNLSGVKSVFWLLLLFRVFLALQNCVRSGEICKTTDNKCLIFLFIMNFLSCLIALFFFYKFYISCNFWWSEMIISQNKYLSSKENMKCKAILRVGQLIKMKGNYGNAMKVIFAFKHFFFFL